MAPRRRTSGGSQKGRTSGKTRHNSGGKRSSAGNSPHVQESKVQQHEVEDDHQSGRRMQVKKETAAAGTPSGNVEFSTTKELAFEFITELLGFVPINYIDDVINGLTDLIYKGVATFEEWLEGSIAAGKFKMTEDNVESGLAAIETLFESNCDKYFDRFELYLLRSIFAVPSSLLLCPQREGGRAGEINQDTDISAIPQDSPRISEGVTLPGENEPHLRLPMYDIYYNNMANNTEEDEQKLDVELEEIRRKVLAAEYLRKNIELQIDTVYQKNKILEKFLIQLSKLNRIRTKRRKSSILPEYNTISSLLNENQDADREDESSESNSNEAAMTDEQAEDVARDSIQNIINDSENMDPTERMNNDKLTESQVLQRKRKILLDDPRFDLSNRESITSQLNELYEELRLAKELADEIKFSHFKESLA